MNIARKQSRVDIEQVKRGQITTAAKDPVDVHDFQATILHLLGFDHTALTFRFQGRDYRLTDVHGRVVEDILA